MSSPESRKAVCKTKAVYLNIEVAREAASRLLDKYGNPLKPYPCPWCGRWHLTTDRRAKAILEYLYGEEA